jgi:hypothetical protein
MSNSTQETSKTYQVKFKIIRSLSSDPEPDDYICNIAGEIKSTDEAGNDSVAGTLQGYIVQAGRIINEGESLFDACDAHSQTVHDYACVLFDSRSGELKSAIEEQFGVVPAGDVLILDKIEVLPAHRGRGLGLAAACCFLDTFESGCCLAVAEPYPLQFKDITHEHPDWCAKMGVDAFVADKKRATAKLQVYWSRLGFRRIRGSKKFALSLQDRRPALKELAPEL